MAEVVAVAMPAGCSVQIQNVFELTDGSALFVTVSHPDLLKQFRAGTDQSRAGCGQLG